MKYLIHSIVALIFVSFIFSCDDMNDIHQKYLDEGEDVYIGYPNILTAHGGYERVQLVWKINADPKIDECCIYWNNRQDSLTVAPDRTDTVMRQIVPLPEGKYILEMVNKSQSGYRSLVSTISTESYGEAYREQLFNRVVTEQVATPRDITLTWSLEEGCVGTYMKYKNNKGEQKEVFIEGEQTTLKLDDYVLGGSFTYSSLYLPEIGAIDTIATKEDTGEFPNPEAFVLSKEEWETNYHADYMDLDRGSWTVTANTEELKGEAYPNGPVGNILDGDFGTHWHSQWQGDTPTLPHQIDIDMQEEQTITTIELARRNGNRDTKKVVFYISSNGTDWTKISELEYPNDSAVNSKVLMYQSPVKGRYLRLMVTESHNAPHASLAEILLTTSK